MNQQKIQAVRKYLYQGIETHLKTKAEAERVAVERTLTEDLKELNKHFKVIKKHTDAYNELFEELERKLRRTEVKGYLRGRISLCSEPSFSANSSTRQFAALNSQNTFYCNETQIAAAKDAVRDVDRFCLQLMLDGNSSDVEQFLTNLLNNL